jgi:hypothetical protein
VFHGLFAISASNFICSPFGEKPDLGRLVLEFEIARLLGVAADSFALSRSCFTSSTQWAWAIAFGATW